MAVSYVDNFFYYTLGLYFVAMALEWAWSTFEKKPVYTLKDTFVNMTTGLYALFVPYILGLYVFTQLYYLLSPYAFFKMTGSWSELFVHHQFNPMAIAIIFVVDDFTFYWYHRINHEIRLLWCIHEGHHSSDEYNLSTYFRASFLEYFLYGIFWVPMIFIGFTLEDMIFQMSVNLFYQFFIHTKYTNRIPVLEYIFNTPKYHRLHHARNIPYLDKNYGGIFIFWDRMFSTFVDETEAPLYGVLSPANSHNPITIATFGFQGLWADLKSGKKNLKDHLGYVLGPPGWRHDGPGTTSKVLQSEYKVVKT